MDRLLGQTILLSTKHLFHILDMNNILYVRFNMYFNVDYTIIQCIIKVVEYIEFVTLFVTGNIRIYLMA